MPPSQAMMRALVDLRVMVVIDHPKLYEESAGQQNWGYIEKFTDDSFVVKLEEGVFDFWVFPIDLLEWIKPPEKGDVIYLQGLCPGYRAIGVRGPNARELVRELLAQRERGRN